MLLRPANIEDIPLIRDLADRIWWAHYPAIIGEEQVEYMLGKMYSTESLETQMSEGQVFWLPEENEAIFGFVAVRKTGDQQYFIHKFYIDQERQGRGVGARIFAAVLDQYPDAREIRLTVNRQNYKSINFYFKVGFIIEQCLDIPIGHGFVMNDFQMVYRRPQH